MNLSKKLIIAFLLVSLVPLSIVMSLSLFQASNSLENQVYSQLEAVRQIKKNAVERYFQQIQGQVSTLSQSSTVIDAMVQLPTLFDNYQQYKTTSDADAKTELKAFYENQFKVKYEQENQGKTVDVDSLLDGLSDNAIQLQYGYIQANQHPLGNKHLLDAASDNSPYSELHQQIHPYIRSFLEKFGYYDIFLVDIHTGDIVYSVFKELDFATSLINGPYADSNFARAFEQASQLEAGDTFSLVDYAQYLPSYDAPASFIASPIFNGNEKVGVLIFQMPIDVLNNIMREREGLGETGETYLVGADQLMRSDSYLDPDNRSVVNSFRNSATGKVSTKAVEQAFKGKTHEEIITDYNGNPVLSAYTLVDVLGLKWALLAEIDKAEAFAPISTLRYTLGFTLIIVIVVIVPLAFRFSSSLTKPLFALVSTMKKVEQTGDFSLRSPNSSKDEIGQASVTFNQLLTALQTALNATNDVMNNMAQGNFRQRITVECSGELATLKTTTNNCAESLEVALAEVGLLMKNMSEGNFKQTIDVPLSGDLGRLKDSANQTVKSLDLTISDIVDVMAGISRGDFSKQVECQAHGQLGELKTDINQSVLSLNSALTEISKVMAAIRAGDFEQRISLPLHGQLNQLKQDINQSVNNLSHVINDISTVLAAFKDGEFDARVDINNKGASVYEGELATLKMATNQCAESLETALGEVNDVMLAMSQGDFSKRIKADLKGELAQLKNNINTSFNTLDSTITDIVDVMAAISQGNFKQQVEIEAMGQLNELKININQTVQALDLAITDISKTMNAISNGNFQQRVESELNGQLQELSSDINLSIENVNGAISEIGTVMTSLRDGDFSLRIQSEFEGQLKVLKEDINASMTTLDTAIHDVIKIQSAVSNGDLTQTVETRYQGAFEQLKDGVNTTVHKLTEVIENIHMSSSSVAAGANQIATQNLELSTRTEQQAYQLEQTSLNMDDMLKSTREMEDKASYAVEISNSAESTAIEGGEVTEQTVSSINGVHDASKKINEIISVIDELAFQTNLLALNAAVEAARAGEHGRGFAVVAAEVRNLASRSTEAAKEIKDIINFSSQKVDEGTTLASLSGEKLKDIVNAVTQVNENVVTISQSTEQQSSSINDVTKTIQTLTDMTQSNAAMVEETASAAQSMAEQASNMKEMMEFFTTR